MASKYNPWIDTVVLLQVLKNADAVDAFKGNHQVALGGSMGVSYGPVGRHAMGELCFGELLGRADNVG